MKVEFTAGQNDAGRRLETVLRRLLPSLPLASVHKALRSGDIRLNGAKAAAASKVNAGDQLLIWDHLIQGSPEASATNRFVQALPESWIVLDHHDWLVVNKPSGVLVQGGPPGEASLDEQVRSFLSTRPTSGLSFRPGPLHRLDRPTSGLVAFSASLFGAQKFSQAMAQGQIRKTYWALLEGRFDQALTVEVPLERDQETLTTKVSAMGKSAKSTFYPIQSFASWTWAKVEIEHGRTHQIRAHAREAGFPLVGDGKYGGHELNPGAPRPWVLHARQLESPLFGRLTAPLDDTTKSFLQKTFKLIVEDADQLSE